MARNVEFDILARDRASKTFDRVGRSADGLGSRIGSLGKGAMMGLGVAAAGAAVGGVAVLGAAMVNGVKDAAAYQDLAAKTAAVLKSTGNVAKQSVKGIQARAAALESLSGVDEEIIINGQNVLATFTNIRDGVGKGNKIFDQATTAALNMSTALGTDMQGAAIQVGKALNNPIKGVAALSRVGVSFTDAQKKQIKTLVDSGKTMEAQKLILKELNTEFGGAAKAAGAGFNGAMARAKDAVGDAFREIGTKLLPVVTRFADYIAKNAGPLIDKFSAKLGEVWKKVAPGLTALAGWFMNEGLPAVRRFGGWISDVLWPALKDGYAAIMPKLSTAFRAVSDFIQDKAIPAIRSLWGWISNDLWPALKQGYATIMPALKQAFVTVAGAFKGTGVDGAAFGEKLRKVGEIITTKVIPFVAKMISYYLPVLAQNIRSAIEVVKVLYNTFTTWRDVVARVISFIVGKFGDMMGVWASVLRALGKVPGFGWAKDAADKMQRTADKAHGISRAIAEIPNSKTVTVNIQSRVLTGRVKVGDQLINPGMYAKGGVNLPRGWKVVGEEGPELMWTPGGDSVIPAKQTRQALSGNGGGGSSRAESGGDQNITVQFVLDGKVLQQSLLKVKRQGGVSLGLA